MTNFLLHPLTAIFFVSLAGIIAWIFKMILDIAKVQSSTTKVLEIILENQKSHSENFNKLRSDFDRLLGQHEIMNKVHEKKTD